ncbi:hypothetical protein [Flaviaesturariibacter aridisoli]|uniref:Uncharacterized protein n=1 Tax=Flaviaesturariibacter aridisoli TaxID=2545761 RepID=A0A4R4DYP6_9BACT|nr:hypothetical protein [Flaviaesturariibacter aridisoli]TCZ66402.1 hypothetical protein E0486_16820 [Flaviaesturariibacter aridisoli]
MKTTPLDILWFEGRQLPLMEALLEPFFNKHPQLRPPGAGRSYWASFEIAEDELRVRDVEVADPRNLRTGRRSVLAGLFESADDAVLRWFSGLLLLEQDKQYFVLEIRRGRLRAKRRYDAAGLARFEQEQFEYFCLTEDYDALRAAAQKEFELKEQEARRKDEGRGYRSFDEAAFRQGLRTTILRQSKELLAD